MYQFQEDQIKRQLDQLFAAIPRTISEAVADPEPSTSAASDSFVPVSPSTSSTAVQSQIPDPLVANNPVTQPVLPATPIIRKSTRTRHPPQRLNL